ncbi:unnamed protein product, partial [marine sediment metagenome]
SSNLVAMIEYIKRVRILNFAENILAWHGDHQQIRGYFR